ncbi:hypothetical protein CR513_51607, partial [Mucuna pruriens]
MENAGKPLVDKAGCESNSRTNVGVGLIPTRYRVPRLTWPTDSGKAAEMESARQRDSCLLAGSVGPIMLDVWVFIPSCLDEHMSLSPLADLAGLRGSMLLECVGFLSLSANLAGSEGPTIFIMKKSEACNTFKSFKAFVEKQSGCRIKELRTARGQEYLTCINFFEQHGIQH